MKNGFMAKISGQFENVFSQFLNIVMLRFRYVICQHMNLAAIIREIRRNFLAHEGIRQMRDLESAGNGIVIGDGHHIHPLFSGGFIDLHWIGKTFRTADFLQHPLGSAF